MDPVVVNDTIILPPESLEMSFIHAAGPGGQNVNKVATAVQLRFDMSLCPTINGPVRARLRKLAGRKLTKEGIILIEANRHRTQERNRADALERLCEMIRSAAIPPRKRIKTRPTLGSKKRRIEGKKKRGAIKANRRAPGRGDE